MRPTLISNFEQKVLIIPTSYVEGDSFTPVLYFNLWISLASPLVQHLHNFHCPSGSSICHHWNIYYFYNSRITFWWQKPRTKRRSRLWVFTWFTTLRWFTWADFISLLFLQWHIDANLRRRAGWTSESLMVLGGGVGDKALKLWRCFLGRKVQVRSVKTKRPTIHYDQYPEFFVTAQVNTTLS